MGKSLDPTSAAVRALDRTEPVLELARKKSPIPAAQSFDDHQPGRDREADEFAVLQTADLPAIALPRDSNKPLITANEKYAKQALEAYKSLRTRILRSQATHPFQSLAIASVGRADGKTLTAFNLACCCAQVENLTVLLIDGDLRNRSLTKLIGGMPPYGLADVMSGAASCEEAIVSTDVPNLFVMGAGKSGVPSTELFSTPRWNHVMRWSRHQFKMVLVDSLCMGACADFELIAPECDGVLLVVRARSTSREALKSAIEQIDSNKLLGIVWNGTDSRNGNGFYAY